MWRFRDPADHGFARCGWLGTWSPGGGLCDECTASNSERISPLLLTWLSGSDVLGDFCWPASGIAIVDRVAEVLRPFGGYGDGPVEIVEDRHAAPWPIGPPTGDGSALRELLPTVLLDVDPERSTVALERRCSICARERWTADGLARIDSTYDRASNTLIRTQIDRQNGEGIFIDGAAAVAAGVFRVRQFPAWTFCTDEVRLSLTGCSNVSFLEMGELF